VNRQGTIALWLIVVGVGAFYLLIAFALPLLQ
jgi:hypothetical protein